MGDFNPGPTYRGDPGVPHANEKSFTARAWPGAVSQRRLTRARSRQAFLGGLWVVLGMQFVKDICEVRPLHRRVARAAHLRWPRSSPRPRRCSPDHVMAMCEEAYKRKQLKRGLPYRGKLPVRAQKAAANPIALAPRWRRRRRRLPCTFAAPSGWVQAQAQARCSRCGCGVLSDAASRAQSPIYEDGKVAVTKAPRIVKWKLDRMW